MAADRALALLRSGWPPATLVATLTTSLQLASGTSPRDLASFAAYALVCLVVPGTLLWRLLRPRRDRPWLEDVALGTCLGYAVEIVFYVAARWVGQPLFVLAWPALVYAAALLSKRGRQTWRPDETVRLPTGWSWSVAGVIAYLVLFVARANWWETGVAGNRLRVIGPDGSFQLALTGELRHHVPPAIPWVSGEPLHYHWLTYVHTATATWVTGVEPIVVLRRFAPLLMAVVVVLAVAVIASALARRPPVGAVAAALLVLVHSPAFYAAESDHFQRQEFTSSAIFGSPTMTFGTVLFCGVLFLVLEVLSDRASGWTWPMLALMMAATSGAKATFPPMLVAAALTVVVVALLMRAVKTSHLALLALTVAVWLAFQFGFYGGESTGARLSSAGTLDFAAASFGATTPEPLSVPGIALASVIVLLWVAHMAGMLGQLPRGGWHSPDTAYLWGLTVSGIGASLLLDLGAASQQWFVASTQVAVAVGASVGLGRLLPPGAIRPALPVVVPAAVVALFGMATGWALTPVEIPPTSSTMQRLWEYSSPFLLTVLLLVTAAAVIAWVSRSRPVPMSALLFLCVGLTALGLFRTIQVSAVLARLPWQSPPMPSSSDTTVGRGGVETSRWVRAHTRPDDLLATNGHTLTPASDYQLAFWLAGYAERRVLVESWGYTPHHARIMASTGVGFDEVPFWDPALLEKNDRAFTSPSQDVLTSLRNDHGVDLLVLDRRFPSDPEALSRLLEPAVVRGDYLVFDLDDLS